MKLKFDSLSIREQGPDLPSPIAAGDRDHFRGTATRFSRGENPSRGWRSLKIGMRHHRSVKAMRNGPQINLSSQIYHAAPHKPITAGRQSATAGK